MKPKAVLKHHSNSFPFEERSLDLSGQVKVGRAVAKCKPAEDNAIFDCKVLSRNHAVIWFENGRVSDNGHNLEHSYVERLRTNHCYHLL